jgi:hypothetical protein
LVAHSHSNEAFRSAPDRSYTQATDAALLSKTLSILGALAGTAYLLAGILGGAFWPAHWEEASAADQALWLILLAGGGVLLLAGLWLFQSSPWTGAALISLGAVAGSLVLFWTLAVPIVAIALVVLSVRNARRYPLPG